MSMVRSRPGTTVPAVESAVQQHRRNSRPHLRTRSDSLSHLDDMGATADAKDSERARGSSRQRSLVGAWPGQDGDQGDVGDDVRVPRGASAASTSQHRPPSEALSRQTVDSDSSRKSFTEAIAVLSDAAFNTPKTAANAATPTLPDQFEEVLSFLKAAEYQKVGAGMASRDLQANSLEGAEEPLGRGGRGDADTGKSHAKARGDGRAVSAPSAPSSRLALAKGDHPRSKLKLSSEEAASLRSQTRLGHASTARDRLSPQAEPGEPRGGLRRQKSAVFSLKGGSAPSAMVPAAVSGPRPPSGAPAALLETIDKILPPGLRSLLKGLENHCDLGVMALYASALDRHQRLSSALLHLQALDQQAKKEPAPDSKVADKASKPPRPPRARRWALARWQRGILFPFGVPVPPPPPAPLPPLPPGTTPDWFALERCLQEALREGLGAQEQQGFGHGEVVPSSQLLYDCRWAADACKILAASITRSARKLNFMRYKTACVVRIIQKINQQFCSHFSALWDSTCDTFCSTTYETDTFIAQAMIALVYYD